jgi:hypothetical protein
MSTCLQAHRERLLTNVRLRSHFVDHRNSLNSGGGRIARLAPIWFGTVAACRSGTTGHGAEASPRRQPISTWP